MKKYLIATIVALMTIFVAFAVTSCGDGNSSGTGSNDPVSSVSGSENETISEEVDVRAVKQEASIAIADLSTFNFGSLFEIYVDGAKIYIEKEYIDASEVKPELGTYTVTCSYMGKQASVTIKITHERNVSVTALQSKVTIRDTEITTYDYKSLFEIRVNDIVFEISDDCIDFSGVMPEPDTYTVTCSYDGKTAKVWVTVTETPFIVAAYESDVYVNIDYVDKFDLTSLFGITLEGEEVKVTGDMIFGEIKSETGDYEITLKIGSRTAVATVHVTDEHVIKIGAAYGEISLTPEEISSYDFLSVFYIYEDGKSVKVTDSMIDKSALEGAAIGDTREVVLTYVPEDGKGRGAKSVIVNVSAVGSVSINVKTAEVFDGEIVDATELFEITENGKSIEVTADMITGKVEFENGSDECEITLRYKGYVKIATVKKISGVSVKYPHGEVISVKVGTEKQSYDFASDFVVYINGIKFDYIDSWINRDDVDFTAVGTYAATLTVQYNDVNVGRGKPKFAATAIKTITYEVVPNVYELSLNDETVEVGYGVTSYNALDNINLIVNGYKQAFTSDPSKTNSLTTYCKVISAPNIMVFGLQKAIVDVYVYGADYDPVRVTYDFVVKRGIEIIASDKAYFTGDTIYAPDLFKIYDEGKPINVSLDMISGIVDSESEGIYEISVSYKGVVRTAIVSVVPNEYLGTYVTPDKTIAKDAVEGEDGDVAEDAKPAESIGNMIVGKDMSIDVHGVTAENVKLRDYGLSLSLKGNNHEVHIFDGIAVFIPLNEIRLTYHEDKRPLVYFNTSVWTILDTVTVNSSANGGVYSDSINGGTYSIFLYRIKNASGEIRWFATKVKVEYKGNGDTIYSVVYGYTSLPAGFKASEIGAKASFVLDDSVYAFALNNRNSGIINSASTNIPFEGMTFSGTFDGKSAVLTLGSEESPTLKAGGITVFSMDRNEFSSKKYGSSAYDDTITVYGLKRTIFNKKNNTTKVEYDSDLLKGDDENSEEKVTTEVFSYKFILDTENGTFTLAEKDEYYGLYKTPDGRFIFIDGFGRGVVDTDGSRTGVFGFNYEVNGSEFTLRYMDKSGKLSVKEAKLAMDGFGNVLKVKDMGDEFERGTEFTNTVITHGAIVTIGRTVFYKGESKDAISDSVRIVTADGEYTSEKKNGKLEYNDSMYVVDRQKVSMSYEGFYYIAVNIEFDKGARVETKVFAVQVIEEKFAGSAFARNYGDSISGMTSFAMDKYGVVTFVSDGTTYTGMAHESNGKLYAIVKSSGKPDVSLEGEVNEDGLLTLTAKAKGLLLTENYCSGTVVIVGNGEFILRSFATVDGNVFYVSSAKSLLGEKTEVETIDGESVAILSEGLIVRINYGGKSYILRIAKIGDDKNGFEASDMLDGEYKYTDSDDEEHVLTLDGFGTATLDGEKWNYTVVGDAGDSKRLTLVNPSQTALKRILLGVSGERAGQFVDRKDVTVDTFDGKSYTLEINFYSQGESWGDDSDTGIATSWVYLTFGMNGRVELTFACTEDPYNEPTYIGTGKATVNFKTVVIEVNGYKITMSFDDVWTLKELKIKGLSRPDGYDEEYGELTSGKTFERN